MPAERVFQFRSEEDRIRWLFWFTLGVFLVLVGGGITGSSLGWLKTYPGVSDIMELQGERKLAGIYRGIRGDEFLAHGTPNALAQYHAKPRFPRLNPNLGVLPRDLTVHHDTGIPVDHYVTLARPAVWGFYLFDLRRALAWYWWFPVFAGFFGIWFLLNTLFPGDTFRNWLLSLSLTASPLCAAWSFWQLGNLAGLCFAAAALIRLIRCPSAGVRCLWAALMVWGGLCSAMTLYMPRVFPVGCLLALVVLAYLAENHLFEKLKQWPVWLPVMVAAAAGVLFLLGWLRDASEAVRTLLETSYPGQRRMSGGTMELWTLVKGWLAPLTIYKVEYQNQCELQGPLSLLFPLAAIWLVRFRELKKSPMAWAVVLFTVWTSCYQLTGFPDWLAALTFWNRCNPPRCALALSLAQILFLALIFSRFPAGFLPGEPNRRRALVLTGGCVLLFVFLLLYPGMRPLLEGLKAVYHLAYLWCGLAVIALIFGLVCGLLLVRSRWFIPVFVLVNFLPAACFNPVCIAPVKVINKLEPLVKHTPGLKYGGRFLFLEERNFTASAAFAAGARVLNGYFIYPDRELHRLLFQNEPDPRKSFRLSNYDLIPVHGAAEPMKIQDDGWEHIFIYLNAEKFDFRVFPADFAAGPKAERQYLDKNPSLKRISGGSELDFYRIIR